MFELVFLDPPQGGDNLCREDHYIDSLVPFDLEVRTTKTNATLEDYHKLLRSVVIPWTEEDITEITNSFNKIFKGVQDQGLTKRLTNLPKRIKLIKINGKDEDGASYCRHNDTIVLSEQCIFRHFADDDLLAHELFHIISRNHPYLRMELYQSLGFQSIDPSKVILPERIQKVKLTNPDAPLFDVVIPITLDSDQPDKKEFVLPICYSKPEEIKYGRFLKYGYMTQLLIVERDQNGFWQAKVGDDNDNTDNSITLLEANECNDFWAQVGRNTDYIEHPEEILADNFVILVFDRTGSVPSPDIIEKMKEILIR